MDVKPSDRLNFNKDFVGRLHKIKVGVAAAGNNVETDREREPTEKRNNNSRGFSIEAAVVRIMKQREETSHQQLVTETLNQLATQSKPDINVIKRMRNLARTVVRNS
ncbi:hypothetical protein W97_07842 [Coniosporium apollinis CBS 100218]|uniref:Cullin neddylation domain-containing protein n=1 Tax=Coniosporium apollinis (strain CBS 100218) TaxID=1168221 RepID=R7Z3K5_CONA1|nr:uncharacterized protein W97_07842 [Coniosporium apollinis CBS 100218]EON68584.1 hypothetical protein W97_07842 [Coniosporium apollinis CBS 100218]